MELKQNSIRWFKWAMNNFLSALIFLFRETQIRCYKVILLTLLTPKKFVFLFFFFPCSLNLRLWNDLPDLRGPLMISEPVFISTLTSLPKCRTGGGRYKRRTLLLWFTTFFVLLPLFAMIWVPGRSLLSTLQSPTDSQRVSALWSSPLCCHVCQLWCHFHTLPFSTWLLVMTVAPLPSGFGTRAQPG